MGTPGYVKAGDKLGELAQEMWDIAQHNFEACCRLDKRLGNDYTAYRYAERRIKELEAVAEAVASVEAENQRLQDGIQTLLRFTPYTKEQVGAITALLGGEAGVSVNNTIDTN